MHALRLAAAMPQKCKGVLLLAPTRPFNVESEIGVDIDTAPDVVWLRQILAQTGKGDALAWLLSILPTTFRMKFAKDIYQGMMKLRQTGQEYVYQAIVKDGTHGCVHTYREDGQITCAR